MTTLKETLQEKRKEVIKEETEEMKKQSDKFLESFKSEFSVTVLSNTEKDSFIVLVRLTGKLISIESLGSIFEKEIKQRESFNYIVEQLVEEGFEVCEIGENVTLKMEFL